MKLYSARTTLWPNAQELVTEIPHVTRVTEQSYYTPTKFATERRHAMATTYDRAFLTRQDALEWLAKRQRDAVKKAEGDLVVARSLLDRVEGELKDIQQSP